MSKVINCECGQRVYGDDEKEVIANAQQHITESHPDLVGKVSQEDLLAMSQEV